MKKKRYEWLLVEKDNHLIVHAIFSSKEGAEYHLKNVIPTYVEKRYFTNKALTADSFTIIER